MKTDIYNKIIEVCEQSLKEIPISKSHIELAFTMTVFITTVSGICYGAIEAEKKADRTKFSYSEAIKK